MWGGEWRQGEQGKEKEGKEGRSHEKRGDTGRNRRLGRNHWWNYNHYTKLHFNLTMNVSSKQGLLMQVAKETTTNNKITKSTCVSCFQWFSWNAVCPVYCQTHSCEWQTWEISTIFCSNSYMYALCLFGSPGPPYFLSRVVFLYFSSLPCFCTFYRPIQTHL